MSSLDAEIRRDNPEQVVSEYLREPSPELGEGELRPTKGPMPVLIKDTDEEDPSTSDLDAYQPYEEEPKEEQTLAPQVGVELEVQAQNEEEEQNEEEQDEGEGEPKAVEAAAEEEEEAKVEVEIKVEVEVEDEPEEAKEEEE